VTVPGPAGTRRSSRGVWVSGAFGALLGLCAWQAVQGGGFYTPVGRTWIVLGGVVALEGIPLWIVWAGFVRPWYGELGLRRPAASGWGAWGLGLAVAAGYAAATLASNPAMRAHVLDVHVLQVLGLCAAVVAGIVEEGVFRRLLMDVLSRRGVGAPLQVVASALFFGLGHAAWGLLGGSLHFALVATAATTLLGAGLAVTYLVGRRSLGPCVVAHVLLDAVLEPWLVYVAVGGR
jgi:CAAX protease family protein